MILLNVAGDETGGGETPMRLMKGLCIILSLATSVKGAQSSAMAYSVINTAAANRYDVKEYLTNLFQNHGGQPPIKSE